ncbi:helix-turn-helix domain-containing protein [Lampropedia aestuarii]|uniref:helix-turn-helix domain-containing protein n=1 Tax=Lampropedia aestuarii TaxID=2562762 RepID=UPI002468A5FE|nr:helix-turn-helix domain-containing protein [Lampropedia aestuarii]MDH5855724.1 helix-turn-helix domain-containing protein [Lampropedia aestuarii]
MSDKEIHNNNQDLEDAEQMVAGLSKPSIEAIDTPGALLRHYRQERQVSVQELAAVLKVSPEKLDALENDRYEALPDIVFTRALAMSICRLLAVDSAAVMAKFPSINSPKLGRDSDGLNCTFKDGEQPALGSSSMRESSFAPKAMLLVAGLLVAAAAVYFWPQIHQIISPQDSSSVQAQAGANAVGSGQTGSLGGQSLQVPGLMALQSSSQSNSTELANNEPYSAQLPSGPTEEDGEAAANGASDEVGSDVTAASADAASPTLQAEVVDTIHIVAQEPVWVQIRDGANAIVHQSTLPKGRELSIANNPPLRVEIGRADAVQVMVKGQAFDLTPHARKNVARFEVLP